MAAGDQLRFLIAAIIDDGFVQAAEAGAGIGADYSMPSDLMTSTMKSEPGRVSVRTSSFAGVPISASAGRGGGGRIASLDLPRSREAVGLAANAAAPTAAFFVATPAGLWNKSRSR